MTHTFTHAGRWARLRAPLLALVVLASACDSAEQLATTEPSVLMDADGLAPADSTASTDSVSTDSAATESISADLASMDVVALFDPTVASASATTASTPFGPTDLYRYSWHRPAVSGFSGGLLYASPSGIIKLLNGMKKHNTRAFLKMTGDNSKYYMTRGRFDFNKWKKATAKYNTPAIKKAIAEAVRSGNLLGYSMIDEANRFAWGTNAINKAMVDRMATYSKSLFPTLPTAVVATYVWRPTERYKVVDVMIAQTWKPKKSSAQFAREAVAAAKQNGVGLAFSLNLKAGPNNGMMTSSQIRDWATTLGRSGCAMIVWRYEKALFSKQNQALKDVASKLSREPAPRCRRGGAGG